MSYILDALRRAESERQRGQLPGLGALPLPPSDVSAKSASPVLRWSAIGLAVLASVVALAWWLRQPAQAPVAGNAAPAVAATQSAAHAPAALPPSTVQAPVGAPVAPAAALASAPLAATAGAMGSANPSLAPVAPVPGALPRVVSAPPVAAPGPAPVAAEAATDKRALKLAELTAQQRSDWPPLSVGGSVWSDSAASRFVILNGQVLREGQAVSPGLTLERIQPRAVQLRWRGLLVELPL